MGVSKNLFIYGFILILFVNLSSAYSVSVSSTSLSGTLKQGKAITLGTLTVTIDNTGSNNSIQLPISLGNVNSELPTGLVISSDKSQIDIPANSQKTETITFTITSATSVTAGTYNPNNKLFLGSNGISFSINLQEDLTGKCRVYTLPIPLSKTLEAGATASQSIDVYVSKYCNDALTISTNQPQRTKPITFDSISGLVEPSQKFSVTLKYDTAGVQTGTYTDNIIVSAVDEDENQYSLTIPISLTITGTISPISNGTISTFPNCALSSSTFNINTTYSVTCQNIDANLDLQPVIDDNYIKGINQEETSNTYTYYFKPKKYGITNISIKFLLRNAEIGDRWGQQISITGSGGQTGTAMDVRFYPNLYEVNDTVTIRAIDNSSGDILYNVRIYIDGIEVNSTIKLEPNKDYELRLSHDGYPNLVKTININPKPINFSVLSSYKVGDELNFSTDPSNCVVSLNDDIVELPFRFDSAGNFKITVSKTGYTSTSKTITVSSFPNKVYSTPSEEAGQGKEVTVEFERADTNLSATLKYSKNNSEVYIQTPFIGKLIKFKLDEEGLYNVYADGIITQSYQVNQKEWYKQWWGITGLSVMGLFIIIFIIRKINSKSSSTASSPTMFMESMN